MIRTLCILLLLAGCTAKKETQTAADAAAPPPMMQPKAEASKQPPKEEESAPKPSAAAMSLSDSNDDPLASSTEITSGKLEIKGEIAPEEVNRVIKKALPAIKFCYDEARQKNPTLSGKMKVSFVITSSGDVTSVKTKEGLASDLDDCVSRKFAQFKFTPPTKGTAEVSYPLVFTAN